MSADVSYNTIDTSYTFNCPHCGGVIQVIADETACCIFRHAVYKCSFQQINPHTSESDCKRLVDQGMVVGCARPFKLIIGNPTRVSICDYI